MVYYQNDIAMETNMNLELKKNKSAGNRIFPAENGGIVPQWSNGAFRRY